MFSPCVFSYTSNVSTRLDTPRDRVLTLNGGDRDLMTIDNRGNKTGLRYDLFISIRIPKEGCTT